MTDDGDDTQRLDKWLWCARFFKTRGLASKVLGAGHLRLSGKVVAKAHQRVRVGDVLTFPQGPHVRVVEVLSLAERRGPAPEARTLYNDLSPPSERRPEPADPTIFATSGTNRDKGAGRPTKRDRRAIDRLMDGSPMDEGDEAG
ncbi:MAG: RNA-binding S4 domain-containing protein [Alphaproteobacteria bacterium]|nr:RNA-binding S4 domain-containing protein [Alphaproteobacteria bacterium]